MAKGAMIFILVILAGIVAYLGYFAFVNFYSSPSSFKVGYAGENNPAVNSSVAQFYPNMRFPDKEISYYFGVECPGEKREKMTEAFYELENKTLLRFYEVSEGDIEIRCGKEYSKGSMFVAGEGGPVKVINGTKFNVILSGQILLLYSHSCSSNVELHELLHVLGFGHSLNPESVMYNITSCEQRLDEPIVDEINRLYKTESLPDLYLSEVSASKKGMYLSLNFSVRNQGLKDAENVEVILSGNGKTYWNEPIEEVKIGEGRIFSIENLKVSLGAERLELSVYYGKEIDYKNNNATLEISE